jgi:hypothetical protein
MRVRVWVMVFNATFNNISVISWQSFLSELHDNIEQLITQFLLHIDSLRNYFWFFLAFLNVLCDKKFDVYVCFQLFIGKECNYDVRICQCIEITLPIWGWFYYYLCNQCLSPLMLFKSSSGDIYVIKFVSDFRQVGDFLWALWFPPPIKLTATI